MPRRRKSTQEDVTERKLTQKRSTQQSDTVKQITSDDTVTAAKESSGRRTETVIDPHISYVLNKVLMLEGYDEEEGWMTQLYLTVDDEFYIELDGKKVTLSAEQVHRLRTQICQHTQCTVVGTHPAHDILAHNNVDLDDIPPFAYSETIGPLKNPKVPKTNDILQFFNDYDRHDNLDDETVEAECIQTVEPCKSSVADDWECVKANKAWYVAKAKRVLLSLPMPVAYDLPPGSKLTTKAMQLRWSKTQHAAREEILQLLMRKRQEGQKQYAIARIHKLIDEVIDSHEKRKMKVPATCGAASVSQMLCSERLYLIMRALRTAEAAKYDLLIGSTAELITSPSVIPHRKLSNARNNAGKQIDNLEAKEAKGVKKVNEDTIMDIVPREHPMSLTFSEQLFWDGGHADDTGSAQHKVPSSVKHNVPRQDAKKRKATDFDNADSYQPDTQDRKVLAPKSKKQKFDGGAVSKQENNGAGMCEAGLSSQAFSQAPAQYTTGGALDSTGTGIAFTGYVQDTPYFTQPQPSAYQYPDPQVYTYYGQPPSSSTQQYTNHALSNGLQQLDQFNRQYPTATIHDQLNFDQQLPAAQSQGNPLWDSDQQSFNRLMGIDDDEQKSYGI